MHPPSVHSPPVPAVCSEAALRPPETAASADAPEPLLDVAANAGADVLDAAPESELPEPGLPVAAEAASEAAPPAGLTPAAAAEAADVGIGDAVDGATAPTPEPAVDASMLAPAPAPAPRSDPVLDAAIRGSVRAGAAAWPDDGPRATASRAARFERALSGELTDAQALRGLAWSGVPAPFRTCTWQMLLGYCPLNRERQAAAIAKKRAEYHQVVSAHFGGRGRGSLGKSDAEQALLHQVLVDVPRTAPDVPLVHVPWVQRSLERVLYLWALRHPASGYVQGIDDLATPLFAVFLSPWAGLDGRGLEAADPLVSAADSASQACPPLPPLPPLSLAGSRGRRGGRVLVPDEAPRWDPGSLHALAAGHPAHDLQAARARTQDRR